VFGCRVYALPARANHPDKLLSDAQTGIFLSFVNTFKNILYYDMDSETVKTAQHAVFDEAMIDHPSLPPNARLLTLTSLSDPVPADLSDAITIPDLQLPFTPFIDTSLTMSIRVD
jgi:hypothetical protein